mmetsp:Transcript_46488/g.99538  ORF Transcript_46488/g.99538 Transcript_46488/m.99538 type:complete len:946 (-) Transcript_46488:316-3153(-)|eukprot:CAMPEP_0206448012 /NCGR_PEP_ID=MMETSP0324_2-20121206/17180_1 /ASSEMBLY_ACC=CAM_ASM_000836 /TAXON_ID=2866 /ORGANISM="Crypthecodinium cohnii, Strain Seligo" /LENGTH=945 /DNA_ID=CAMNT_0053916997 /DNA_START=169 /DNA_END=3009 /DNA_ORIENTATION=+
MVGFAVEEDEKNKDKENADGDDPALPQGESTKSLNRSKSRMATRALTSHVVQQEIMRQVIRDENLSKDITTFQASVEKMATDQPKSGEDILKGQIDKERNTSIIRHTANLFSKDPRRYGIGRRALLRAVMEDERQFKTCVALPMTLVITTLFIVFFQMHYNTAYMYDQESLIRSRIGEDVYDINNAAEIYEWLGDSLMPYLWTIPNVPTSAVIDSTQSDAATQTLVGGVLFRMAKGPLEVPCSDIVGVDNVNCTVATPAVAVSGEQMEGWEQVGRRLERSERWAESARSWFPTFLGEPKGLENLYYPPERSNADVRREKAKKKAKKLEKKREFSQVHNDRKAHDIAQARAGVAKPMRTVVGGLPTLTKKQDELRQRRLKELKKGFLDNPVAISGVAYHKDIPISASLAQVSESLASMAAVTDSRTLYISVDFYLKHEAYNYLTLTQVEFFFNRGGNVLTIIHIHTNTVDVGKTSILLLVLFSISLFRLSLFQAITLGYAIKKRLWKTILKFGVIVDWVIILLGWIIIILILTEFVGMRAFASDWDTYTEELAKTADADRYAFDSEWVHKFHENMSSTNEVSSELITWVSVYTVLLLGRYLIATLGHPRLAIITRPLLQGSSDLFHLFFVYMLVFLAYVLSGHILMGSRMEELATFKASFGYCLQIVYQRQFDWDLMTGENMGAAAFWVVTFVLALVLVMVNLMLAIIFEHYAAVRDEVNPRLTIAAFVKRLFLQLRTQSAWISNTDLLVKLSMIPAGESPSFQQVKRLFPDISDAQLGVIFDLAADKVEQKLTADTRHSLSEYFAGLLLLLRETREGIHRMAEHSAAMASADEGDPQDKEPPVEEEAPHQKPEWVAGGLEVAFAAQRQDMAKLLEEMESMRERIAAKGINKVAGFPIPQPPLPQFSRQLQVGDGKDCSKNLEKDVSKQAYPGVTLMDQELVVVDC